MIVGYNEGGHILVEVFGFVWNNEIFLEVEREEELLYCLLVREE